ncbi:MAG: hypothetical protein A2Y12_19265 [Planctomycetes bacterium GWF2_42_9]|nr:MAG: hypothetical protein A2Y12_19265 [Planctomycetes bacterium GWF2_42_9]
MCLIIQIEKTAQLIQLTEMIVLILMIGMKSCDFDKITYIRFEIKQWIFFSKVCSIYWGKINGNFSL